jgi:predicted Ser/Thr protein kinase
MTGGVVRSTRRLDAGGSSPVPVGLLEGASGTEVIGELGHGARTVVYRVRRPGRDGAELALKTLVAEAAPGDLAAFRREAALLASVEHPGLARTHEVGEAGGRPYLVMDLVEGRALDEVLRSGPLDVQHLVGLASDVAGGLSAAHRAGVVHRDVKPHNIVVPPDGPAVLVDFGLAGRVARTGEAGEASGPVVGTLAYSSPEQSGLVRRPVDERSDLYSLGVVLYECAAGQRPFLADDVAEMLRLNATAPVPDLAALRPELPPALVAVIGKLLAKDPDDRYQSATGLLRDLQRISGGDLGPMGPGGDDRRATADGPLVGRARELAVLVSRWQQVRQGRGASALVHGPSGCGKSRLVRELLAAASSSGCSVLHGKAVLDAAVPMAPLRAAVDQHVAALLAQAPQRRDVAIAGLRSAAGPAAGLLAALSPALAWVLQVDRPAFGDRAGDGPGDRSGQFATAVAVFLTELARADGGAVLFVDDAQWLDEASQRVLRQVAGELERTPLFLVVAARDGPGSGVDLVTLRGLMGPTLAEDVGVGNLDDEAVARLVANELGGAQLPAEVTDQLARRVGGNPFGAREYVNTVLDSGLLRPSWGRWVLDTDGLDALALPASSAGLVLERVENLPEDLLSLLRVAAVIGPRFSARLVGRAGAADDEAVWVALGEAVRQRLIEHRTGDNYGFLHDRIREAVLGGMGGDELAALHQRIAEVLDTFEGSEDDALGYPEALSGDGRAAAAGAPAADGGAGRVYAVARHGLLGQTERDPQWLVQRCLAAGRQALAEHAPVEALGFLGPVPEIAAAAGTAVGADVHEQLGIALYRAGRIAEGIAELDRALEATADRLERAHLLGLMARAYLWSWNVPAAMDAVKRALGELRHPLPKHPLRLAVSAAFSAIIGAMVTLTRVLAGRASGRRRQELRLRAELCLLAGDITFLCYRPDAQLLFTWLALPAANRVGASPEYFRAQRSLAMCERLVFGRSGARRTSRAREVAERLGDPGLVAEAVGYAALTRAAGGAGSTRDEFVGLLTEHGRWLDVGLYVNGIASIICDELLRGRTGGALDWYEMGCRRLGDRDLDDHPYSFLRSSIAAQAGDAQEARQRLERARSAPGVDHPGGEQNLLCFAETIALVELGDQGPDFDRATSGFTSLVPKPKLLIPSHRVFYVFQAYGRLAAYRTALGAGRVALRAPAEEAVRLLGTVANREVLRPHYHAARADLRLLDGGSEGALDEAALAEKLALRADVPLALYEVACVRARALAALGQRAQGAGQARAALRLALDHGWALRAQRARAELGPGEESLRPPPPVPGRAGRRRARWAAARRGTGNGTGSRSWSRSVLRHRGRSTPMSSCERRSTRRSGCSRRSGLSCSSSRRAAAAWCRRLAGARTASRSPRPLPTLRPWCSRWPRPGRRSS